MSPAAKMLRPLVAHQWRALAGAGLATVVLTAADLAKPWPLALVVDHVLSQRSVPFTLGPADWRLLALVAATVIAIALAEAAAQYACDLWLQSAGERISHDLRVRVYEHLQRLSLGFHQGRRKGDLVTRVTGDVNAMGDLFSQSLGAMVQAALLAIGMTVVLLAIDPVLALVSLCTSPLLAFLSYAFRSRVRSQARVQRAHDGEIASVANEALSAMAVVKAFGSEGHESARVRAGSERRLAAGIAVARLQARFDGMVGAVRAISTALVLVIGAVRVSHGAISPGELLVFASYTRKAQSPLRSFARELTKVSATMAKADRVAELLSSDDVLLDGDHTGPRATGEVALESVSFGYGEDRPVLDRVSLRVRRGERVALMGPSGAGKSTLGALVARFFDPTAGSVRLDGRDVRDCSLGWLREQVAVVLQDTVLFSGTVHENIAYASDATREDVVAAARAAAAHEFIVSLPLGYDTDLGPQGVALSGGQRQRIGVARTILRDPPVLVLDEPTTGLDAASESAVLDGLQALMRGRTTILITHSPRLAGTAQRIVELRGGRIAAPAAARDPALPLERLLDPVGMRELLDGSLGTGEELGDVEVGRVVYTPHEALAVHYRADVGGVRRDALATVARTDEERVRWLPDDPSLPALAAGPAELARALAIPVPEAPELLGYKPGARAVLRSNGHVLKAYGSARRFEAALAGLCAASAGPVPTGTFAGASAALRLTAQRAVAGRRPHSAVEIAEAAGALTAHLQRMPPAGLPELGPERLLASALRKGELAAAVLPGLRERVDALGARLRAGMPAGLPVRPAHGDLHADQLLVGDVIAVVDFDGLCLAAPALDAAAFAADVVRGRAGDAVAVGEVLERFLAGYGARPEALDWFLATAILVRVAHPFQRQLDGWPERVERMLGAAEAIRA